MVVVGSVGSVEERERKFERGGGQCDPIHGFGEGSTRKAIVIKYKTSQKC